MSSRVLGPKDRQLTDRILGYLNFSSGASDSQFLSSLNQLFSRVAGEQPAWRLAVRALERELPRLRERSSTFSDISQAQGLLRILREELLPAYQAFHADLLFHHSESSLFRPFFVGRACEVILQQGTSWEARRRIVDRSIQQLNDYIGYRPVATLESRRHEPYSHEWVRPIPLYIEGAGVELGEYHDVVERALEIIRSTDQSILRAAHFDPSALRELAVDPRAYDFDHPVSKRPNYHFGQWDPHSIDNTGRYRRFVVQEVTLQALMARLADVEGVPHEELVFEAAGVLAGTMLMASGISGSGPDTHDSTETLSHLLSSVAAYRDTFYDELMAQAAPEHRKRLEREAVARHQPFGGARQHLNAWLSRRRASQLEHMQLARVFAQMGYPEAAERQARVVPTTSARMRCEIDCRLAAGQDAVEDGRLVEATRLADEIVDRLNRGIECGAFIDPWNILGFDAHFSLFPALENSVHDHRADELLDVLQELFGLFSRIWSTAAAEDRGEVCEQVRQRFSDIASWWHQFAAHEVSSVEAVDPWDVFQAAEHVAESLNLWHKGGAAAGNVRFWAPHAHMFDSPRAFSLVIEALLERKDFVASMALLIRWLNQAETVSLERADSSFHELVQKWLVSLLDVSETAEAENLPQSPRTLIRRFFDFLEANAEEYWNVPRFELRTSSGHDESPPALTADPEEEEEDEQLYSAAYDDVVYRDSTDDGIDASLFDVGDASTDELSQESQRISERTDFLSSLARLRKLTALAGPLFGDDEDDHASHSSNSSECMTMMRNWIRHAISNHRQLIELLETVRGYRIPTTGTDSEALVQYDRQRVIKDALLERIAATCVEISTSGQIMLAALAARSPEHDDEIMQLATEFGKEATVMVQVMAAVIGGDNPRLAELWPALQQALADKTLLYLPLSKQGNVRQIVAARCRQCQFQDLLTWLPRRGLWVETCELIEMARRMERNNPVGPGAVTEFDELFKVGYRSLVESLVTSSESWAQSEDGKSTETALVSELEELTEVLLASWLNHSRTLRLSVLERVHDKQRWKALVKFIKRYGHDLFTQRFFHLANLRTILHQGVGQWLERMQQEGDSELRLVEELGGPISREEAVEHLTLILEAIVENYGEYRDYNSTTTQSDRGEMLYILLDFLRLRTQYDRVCWHLKPVTWAHEILVNRQHGQAARLWRQALGGRITEEAERFLRRLRDLQKTYSIRMSTVSDRLAERFIRPMIIDRMCALVRPAMQESTQSGTNPSFELLEQEAEALARESTGIGFDVPVWLISLEEKAAQARMPSHQYDLGSKVACAVDRVLLSRDEIQRKLEACAED
ncbi:MAG: hypothetical protein ACQESR_07475 [Planctomycetota bacterium]